jgi:hypothetical protein
MMQEIVIGDDRRNDWELKGVASKGTILKGIKIASNKTSYFNIEHIGKFWQKKCKRNERWSRINAM